MAQIFRILHKGIPYSAKKLLGRSLPRYALNSLAYLINISKSRLPGTDACVLPVLSTDEAAKQTSEVPAFHPKVAAVSGNGEVYETKDFYIVPGTHTNDVLQEFGISSERMQKLQKEGVFGSTTKSASKL